jgi:hypothetical protein
VPVDGETRAALGKYVEAHHLISKVAQELVRTGQGDFIRASALDYPLSCFAYVTIPRPPIHGVASIYNVRHAISESHVVVPRPADDHETVLVKDLVKEP